MDAYKRRRDLRTPPRGACRFRGSVCGPRPNFAVCVHGARDDCAEPRAAPRRRAVSEPFRSRAPDGQRARSTDGHPAWRCRAINQRGVPKTGDIKEHGGWRARATNLLNASQAFLRPNARRLSIAIMTFSEETLTAHFGRIWPTHNDAFCELLVRLRRQFEGDLDRATLQRSSPLASRRPPTKRTSRVHPAAPRQLVDIPRLPLRHTETQPTCALVRPAHFGRKVPCRSAARPHLHRT
jgi:hypothetical protein